MKRAVSVFFAFLVLTSLMCWNYAFNFIDKENWSYVGFQRDSEVLVTGVIYANSKGVLPNECGLGVWVDILGELDSESRYYVTNDSWENGYSRTDASILILSSSHTKMVAKPGNYVRFVNGEEFLISDVIDMGEYTIVCLQSDQILSGEVYGKLLDATFLDENKEPLPKGKLNPYMSQYGLQGKVFGALGRHLGQGDLNFLCCFATAAVFALIVIIAAYKYDVLFAGCMFATFLLSPWVVNFARNLYWVEFTWFIPMLIGLLCAWKVESRKYRVICYLATFVSILVKCLCGYEYISTIMVGTIAFLAVDFFAALIAREYKKAKCLFGTIVLMGLAAVVGFLVALGIHASMRGEGNLMLGITQVLQDAMRRTAGIDLSMASILTGRELEALTASVWETICIYFNFQTAVLAGIDGKLFPLLCIMPIVILGCNCYARRIEWKYFVMYGVFLLATLSWHVLAQNHSYVHIHMNYVLWYFGFVQTCIYIICRQILEVVKRK